MKNLASALDIAARFHLGVRYLEANGLNPKKPFRRSIRTPLDVKESARFAILFACDLGAHIADIKRRKG